MSDDVLTDEKLAEWESWYLAPHERRLIAALRASRAEVEHLNEEIMGYQVRDGYDKGHEHGQAAAAAEVLRLRTEVERLRTIIGPEVNE